MATKKKEERSVGQEAVKTQMNAAKERQRAALPSRPGNGMGQNIPPVKPGEPAMTQAPAMAMASAPRPHSPAVEALIQQRGVKGVPGKGIVQAPIREETPIRGVGFSNYETGPELEKNNVDVNTIDRLTQALLRYKAGKASIDARIIGAERWWKMRNTVMYRTESDKTDDAEDAGFKAATAWLHNVITNKHAKALEAMPAANILPREASDKLEAWVLGKIIPLVLDMAGFPKAYDDVMWAKNKTGTGVYQIIWDTDKLNGLGDIAIRKANILNLFWEPGINDIQDSRYLFYVELEDKDVLVEKYPELEGKMLPTIITPRKMPHDDHVDMSNKVEVVDCYYKKWQGGRRVLHYVKYVGGHILYASENDPQRRERGFYEHGKYPFVMDVLFPVEDSPCGYGYIDICANPQIRIDLMSTAFLKNTMAGAMPRVLSRADGGINVEEYLDLERAVVTYEGNADAIIPIDHKPLNGNYINFLNANIDEMRETSGNTETATGSSTNGVTAASGIAAMQEASGLLSRAAEIVSYRAFEELTEQCIGLVRQFYDKPRQFRITGAMGQARFISYDNRFLQPQHQGMIGGVDMGYREPSFDIDVVPQKKISYDKVAQNELALQFYSLGFFNPQMADQAMATLEMMDFDGKDETMQRVSQNGLMYEELQKYKLMAALLAAKHEPAMVGGLLNGAPTPAMPTGGKEKPEIESGKEEPKNVERARERARGASQPGGAV